MAMVNVMYQTSLVQFLERFDISMVRSEKTPITTRHAKYSIIICNFFINIFTLLGELIL